MWVVGGKPEHCPGHPTPSTPTPGEGSLCSPDAPTPQPAERLPWCPPAKGLELLPVCFTLPLLPSECPEPSPLPVLQVIANVNPVLRMWQLDDEH